MGQMQPKESDDVVDAEKVQRTRTNALGNSRWNPNDEKDRVSADFKANSPMVNNPATGNGSKGNPGKPV